MGLLVDGKWSPQWYDTKKNNGHFVRDTARYRNWVTADGSAGPSGKSGFAAESGRYHLYVSYACPWAHRTLIFRHLKGLAEHISVSVVHPLMLDEGWTFETDFDGATGEDVLRRQALSGHLQSDQNRPGALRFQSSGTGKRDHRVNESSEIIRI